MHGSVPTRSPDTRLLLSLLDPADPSRADAVAERLGVSASAVEESLRGLSDDGLAVRGADGAYRALPLDAGELRELYPAALILECLAVREAPRYDAELLAELRAANARLRAAGDPQAAIAADDDFHALLLSRCENERLLDVLRSVRRALVRYERAYMVDTARIERSAGQHDAIVAALERADHAAAAGGIRENFMAALPDLAAQIERDGR